MSLYNTNHDESHHVRLQAISHNGQQTVQRTDYPLNYPPAPMMLPVRLPATTTSAVVNSTPSSSTHPAGEQPWTVVPVLRYQETLRAVAEPIITDTANPGHITDTADPGHMSGIRGETIQFVSSTAPATNPPLVRLRLATPYGGRLIVNPAIDNPFVSVGDVQRTVISWMDRVQRMSDGEEDGPGLTRRKMVRARDGTAMEVSVWVWRGLVKVEGVIDLWTIEL